MESLQFNRSFFSRNNDDLFKIAVYFTKDTKFNPSVKEFLCSMKEKGFLSENLNLLGLVDDYIFLYENIEQWFNDLDNVESENDWDTHKSSLLNKFNSCKMVNFYEVESFYHKVKSCNHNEAILLRNRIAIYGNALHGAKEYSFETNKDIDNEKWLLWKDMVKYKRKEIDNMSDNSNLLIKLNEVVSYRRNDREYNESCAALYDKESVSYLKKMEEDFNTILFKKKMESMKFSNKNNIKVKV